MPTPAIPIHSPVWIWPFNLPISCYTAANGNVLLNPNLDVVTHLLFTRCLSSAYYACSLPQRQDCTEGEIWISPLLWMLWCWGRVGEFVGVHALASSWGLGRETCVGVTQESCSTTVAGILKRPSPALHDMYMCPTNKEPAQFQVLLSNCYWGSPKANMWGAAQSFPSGPQ